MKYLRKTMTNDKATSIHYESTFEELADRLIEDNDVHFLDFIINKYTNERQAHFIATNDSVALKELDSNSMLYFINHATHADYIHAFMHVAPKYKDTTYQIVLEREKYK